MSDLSSEDLKEFAAAAVAAGAHLADICDRLATALELPRSEIDRAVEGAVEAGRRLREALWKAGETVSGERPSWTDRTSLSSVVETLAAGLQRLATEGERERLRTLAEELRGGTIAAPKPALRALLEDLRGGAVRELDAVEGEVSNLPWPSHPVNSIVGWFATEDGVAENISRSFPVFTSFLGMLEPTWWKPLLPREAREPAPKVVAPTIAASLSSAGSEESARFAQSHRIDVLQARKALRTAGPGEIPAWAAAPVEPITALITPREGPRFAAPGALAAPRKAESHLHRRSSRPLVDDGAAAERAQEVDAATRAQRDQSNVMLTATPRDATSTDAAVGALAGGEPVAAADLPPLAVESNAGSDAVAIPISDEPRDSGEFTVASEPAISLRAPAEMLPRELASLKEFRDAYWRDERGEVVRAPWLDRAFERKLEAHAEEAMRDGRFAHLIVFARAAEQLGSDACPASQDVRVLVGLLGGPRASPIDSESRRARLGDLAGRDRARSSLASRLAVFLEAITQSPSSPLPPSEARKLAETAGFSPAMIRVLEGFFTVGSAEDEPLARLRGALQNIPKKSIEELSAAVSKSEDDLRHAIRTMWSAAGGKIERTHCREAWQQFMTKAQIVFTEMLAKPAWDDVKRLDGLLGDYTHVADRLGVRFSDRHRMDRSAGELVARARAVVAARREAGRRSRAVQGRGLSELVEAYQELSSSNGGLPNDACFVTVLRRIVERSDATPDEGVGSISVSEVFRRPALLEALPTLLLSEGRGIDAASIANPLSAAAHLMLDVEQPSDGRGPLSRHLRDIGREDLLAHVVPRTDTDAKFAADALGRAQAHATRVLTQARAASVALDGLAHPAAPAVHATVEEADSVLDGGRVHDTKPEFLLAWLSEVHDFARRVLDESIPRLREEFERRNPSPDDIARFQQALAQAQYAELLALARGEGDVAPVEDRATLWRRLAALEFPEPRRTLKERPTRHEELCRLWLVGVRGAATDSALREAFVTFVFDTITRGRHNIKEAKARPETQVSMAPIRSAIAALGLTPSFLPQVTMFREIALLTPSTSPNESMFVRSTTELLARGTDGKMTVLLAPGISSTVRDQLREELRKRSSKGVGIVDDLDLVRLLNPGRQEVNPILALLEVVLEQQPKWSAVNPFEAHEGQHTKPEMFVGRREEADDLSHRALYSRVFSGRRLGKSALLKHVCDSQDHRAKLPSGNRLRVVYVPIVGLDAEDAVVRKIIEAFGAGVPHAPLESSPADRLKTFIDSYLRKEKNGSVLVFLDEADMFVEAQIKEYDKHRERSLTWRMRSELESDHDSQGLPRLRFVFAGYRATHRREGAWANWNDVLRLRPLSRNDAARLIAGPLARLGINATSEAAAIAYRCGYQPAILVRFGQQLIEHLDSLSPARRDAVVVTPEQVAAVYQSPPVHQEIRTIVWNNFQGNPFGQIVFSALLLEFARMPPGAALDDAPSRVLQRLRALVPSFMADESLDGPAVDRIARTLRDFGDRSLIDEVHPTTRSYCLRFPHQLNVLLQEDQEALIRRQAAALAGEPLDAIEGVRSLVARGALEDLAYALSNEGFVSGVVASHWLDGVERRAANIATRLGYVDGEIVDVLSGSEEVFDARRRVALLTASPETAARCLRERGGGYDHTTNPLFVGGLDLLRWALRRWRENREVEVATVPRLTPVQVRWWFERVCEISWSGTSPVPEFMQKTGGIPYLVAQLDRELGKIVGLEGASASDVHIARAIDAYDKLFERAARELVVGNDPAIVLEPREQELLVMIARASVMAFDSPASQQRSDLIDILLDPGGFIPELARFKPLTPDDGLAVDVLLRSGLLSSEPKANSTDPFDRLQVLPPDDPACRIGAMVERCLSM